MNAVSTPVPFITLTRVSRRYKSEVSDVTVLDALDLSIEQGEFVAFMGPSGSGKSTLLNLIGGLDWPDSGAVCVGGEELERLSDYELTEWRSRHVGFVFQSYHLIPVLTAQQNVELPLLLTELSSHERRRHAEIALKIVGLESRAGHRPNQLSGGQQQRVAIARALVTDPSLLVCDEPTGGLDRKTAGEILELLSMLNSEHGKTIVMVTHDPQAAKAARRCLHLDKGVLVTDDPLENAP
jgi:putative ABC transport system ATP-binding protein